MKRYLLFGMTLLLAPLVLAADKATPAAPPAAASGTPNFCDVTYSTETETDDNDDVDTTIIALKAVPWADIEDNHKKNLKILDAMSKNQDKGGPYAVTVTEVRACDGGNNVRIPEGSLFVKGMTLEGSTKVGDVGLAMAKEINDRYKERASKGAKVGWNHKNAKKVKRDDLGRRVVQLQTQ